MKVFTFRWNGMTISAINESLIEAIQHLYIESNGEIDLTLGDLICNN